MGGSLRSLHLQQLLLLQALLLQMLKALQHLHLLLLFQSRCQRRLVLALAERCCRAIMQLDLACQLRSKVCHLAPPQQCLGARSLQVLAVVVVAG
jgi:hypothetical protein